jgi:tRNA pseudouridine55 synthase
VGQRNSRDSSGYILLNKQAGLSSFESLGKIKKALGTGKVGHAGTLDSFAEGLLIVLAGRATKLAPWFQESPKTYRGTILFGEETDTLDGEGAVIARADPPLRSDIEKILPGFTGTILQAPPAYSALHVDGQRAHVLARRGVEVDMKKRPVTIYELSLEDYRSPLGTIRVRCSRGTYIRSLARDLALAAGSRGRLASLTRTAIGGFNLDGACSPEEGDFLAALRPIDHKTFAALGVPCFTVDEKTARDMLCGRPLKKTALEPPLSEDREGSPPLGAGGVFSRSGDFLGIIEVRESGIAYKYVYARKDSG